MSSAVSFGWGLYAGCVKLSEIVEVYLLCLQDQHFISTGFYPRPDARQESECFLQDFTCSGLNLNYLLLGPSKVVLEKQETDTVKFLREECGADCLTHDFAYAFEFGGAFNCWTLDTVRDDTRRGRTDKTRQLPPSYFSRGGVLGGEKVMGA